MTFVSLISRFGLEWGLFVMQQGILKDNNLLSFDCDSKEVKQWVVLSVRRLLKSFICGFICLCWKNKCEKRVNLWTHTAQNLHLRIVVKKSARNLLAIPLHLGKFVRALKVVLFGISREDDWVTFYLCAYSRSAVSMWNCIQFTLCTSRERKLLWCTKQCLVISQGFMAYIYVTVAWVLTLLNFVG